MIKKYILRLLQHPLFVRFFLKAFLKFHNFSYRLVGILSSELEPDGLHPKHRLMRYHDWFASRLEKEWDILDIGCGNGAMAYDMKSACRSVTGVDINSDNIKRAEKQFSKEGVSYICADALDYEFETDFDVFVLSNVLEHIDKRVAFLKKIYTNQNKKKPPVLLLRVPMITRDWITLYKKEVGIEWRLDKTHFTEYSLEQVFDEMNQAGLSVESYSIQFGEFYGVIKKTNESF
jgi:SAM-dependent methyltransferase